MPRPPGVDPERYVDATKFAHTDTELERDFSLDVLPRLQDAGAREGSSVTLRLKFLRVTQKAAIEGVLSGALELTCQRCLGPVRVPIEESFKLVIVADEAALALESGEYYEPIIADASRVDLNWFAEEQALLAMPLVPRHEPGECGRERPVPGEQPASADAGGTQRPFGNLRDMMRGR